MEENKVEDIAVATEEEVVEKTEEKIEEKTPEEIEKELEELNKEADHWETERIKELELEVDKWKDSYIRKVAEFENIRKRLEREKEEFVKYASEKLLVKVLEAVDNLERGIDSSKTSKDFEGLVKGVEMTLTQMHKIMTDEGVEPLESLGQEFNPYEHHAMMQEESDEYENNHVMMELQKGYKMKGKVIRPALVKVAKNSKK